MKIVTVVGPLISKVLKISAKKNKQILSIQATIEAEPIILVELDSIKRLSFLLRIN